MFSHPQ